MTDGLVREFTIRLLDDDEGINEQAWELLQQILHENGEDDIVDWVDSADGRFYLKHDHDLE